MSLHCTSPWRGSQSRISFSIGNLYWRQMNQDAKGDQHQDRSRGPGAKTLSLRPQETHASPGPWNKHTLSTNWASQSQGMIRCRAPFQINARLQKRIDRTLAGSWAQPRQVIDQSEQVNYKLITLAAFTPGLLAANGRKKNAFLFFNSFFFFGQSAFVFKHIR